MLLRLRSWNVWNASHLLANACNCRMLCVSQPTPPELWFLPNVVAVVCATVLVDCGNSVCHWTCGLWQLVSLAGASVASDGESMLAWLPQAFQNFLKMCCALFWDAQAVAPHSLSRRSAANICGNPGFCHPRSCAQGGGLLERV